MSLAVEEEVEGSGEGDSGVTGGLLEKWSEESKVEGVVDKDYKIEIMKNDKNDKLQIIVINHTLHSKYQGTHTNQDLIDGHFYYDATLDENVENIKIALSASDETMKIECKEIKTQSQIKLKQLSKTFLDDFKEDDKHGDCQYLVLIISEKHPRRRVYYYYMLLCAVDYTPSDDLSGKLSKIEKEHEKIVMEKDEKIVMLKRMVWFLCVVVLFSFIVLWCQKKVKKKDDTILMMEQQLAIKEEENDRFKTMMKEQATEITQLKLKCHQECKECAERKEKEEEIKKKEEELKLVWDKALKTEGIRVDADGLTVRKTRGGLDNIVSSSVIWSSGKHQMSFQIIKRKDVMIGVIETKDATKLIEASGTYLDKTYGWLYYSKGCKYNHGKGESGVSKYSSGDTITIECDFDSHTISYYKNTESLGVFFQDLKGPVSPALSLYYRTCVKVVEVVI